MAREEYYHQNIIEIVLLKHEEREIISENADMASYIYNEEYEKIQKFEDDVNLRIQEFEENPEGILTTQLLVPGGIEIIVNMLISSFIINTPFIINTSDEDAERFVWYIGECIRYLKRKTDLPAFPYWLLKEIADIHFDNLFYFGPCKDVSREGLIWYNDNWSDRRDTCIDVLKSLLLPPPPPVADAEMPDALPSSPVAAPPSPPSPQRLLSSVARTPGGELGVGLKRSIPDASQSQQTPQRPRTTGPGEEQSSAAGELFGSPTGFGRKLDKTKGWWVELKKDKKCEMGVKFVRVKNFRKYRYGVHVDPEYFEKMTGASFWDLPLYRCGK